MSAMLAMLVVLGLTAVPADVDTLQGTWQNRDGVRLTIDGNSAAVVTWDGWGFAGQVTVTRRRLRIVEDDGSVVERRWRLEGGRLLLDGVEWRRVLPAMGERP